MTTEARVAIKWLLDNPKFAEFNEHDLAYLATEAGQSYAIAEYAKRETP